jgi:hypothetical protein
VPSSIDCLFQLNISKSFQFSTAHPPWTPQALARPSLLPRNDAGQGSLRRLTGTSTCICFQRRRVVYGTRYYQS